MRYFLFSVCLIVFAGCKIMCDKSLSIGEIVQIPVQFSGFTMQELNNMFVYRIDKSASGKVDTFLLRDITWWGEEDLTTRNITDRVPVESPRDYGYYDSYLDNCHLVFDWATGTDTLSDMRIRKSKGDGGRCHRDDPNIRIDALTFQHNGQMISKNQLVEIAK